MWNNPDAEYFSLLFVPSNSRLRGLGGIRMLEEIRLELIVPAEGQPRKTFHEETLQELAESIKERGVLEPIVVRPLDDGRYSIIMGERRYRASKIAGLETIPCVIRDCSDQEAKVDALLENFQREDLNPVERARAIQDLLNILPMDKVAKSLGVTENTIKRHLDVLDLPTVVLEELVGDKMAVFSEGHALALRALSEDPVTQVRLARKIKDDRLSIEELQRLIQAVLNIPDKKEAFLRVPLSVTEEMVRQTARERGVKRVRPFKPQTAQTHSASLARSLSQLTDLLDPRVVEFISEEDRSTLIASCTAVADGLKEFTSKLRGSLNENGRFQEVYINCALCGRIELVSTPRCSVCWSVMKRCTDCGNYDRTYQQCSEDQTMVPLTEADAPTENSRSFRCTNYNPKFVARKAA